VFEINFVAIIMIDAYVGLVVSPVKVVGLSKEVLIIGVDVLLLLVLLGL